MEPIDQDFVLDVYTFFVREVVEKDDFKASFEMIVTQIKDTKKQRRFCRECAYVCTYKFRDRDLLQSVYEFGLKKDG